MKELFPGYYRPSASTLADIWRTGIISLDANVLLDVFRVSDATAAQLLDTLERLQARLWIPYQVAKEYHTHLESIVADQVKPYDEATKRIESLLSTFSSPRSHPFIGDDLLNRTKTLFEELNRELNGRKARLEELLSDNP